MAQTANNKTAATATAFNHICNLPLQPESRLLRQQGRGSQAEVTGVVYSFVSSLGLRLRHLNARAERPWEKPTQRKVGPT